MEETKICCICGKKYTGWGNDPWPVDMRPDHMCCDDCNIMEVVPARLRKIMPRKEVKNG